LPRPAARHTERGVAAMFKWLADDAQRAKDGKVFGDVAGNLRRLYNEHLLPVEAAHMFHHFYSPPLADADFTARPMVLLMGQYSSGKTTFIRHLLGRDYPGMRVGPEPTTDRFVAVCHGEQDSVMPGNALVADRSQPFTQLSHFGNAFLSKFECAKCNSAPLEGLTLIDTPGILSGEKQRLQRGYDFESIVSWFADRVDMILILFDVAKLDISDELRRAIMGMRGNDHKIHIILNKADCCTTPQLMRIYGALMWNLGKIIDTPEVCRVYIGSFWDERLANDEQRRLFESEETDLYWALAQMPRGAAVRKLSDLIKRARLAKVHAYLMDYLRSKMPYMVGGAKKQKEMIANLTKIYQEIAKSNGIALGDFPDPRMMQEKFAGCNFKDFAKLSAKKMEALERMLSVELPKLLLLIPNESERTKAAGISQIGGTASPFGLMKDQRNEWYRCPDVDMYRSDFADLRPNRDGKVAGQAAKVRFVESKLPSGVLHKIWMLADLDGDGYLTLYEFALAMHLINMRLDGHDLPNELPPSMLPPDQDQI